MPPSFEEQQRLPTLSKDKTWTFSGTQYLYRHKTGVYYARLTISGKPTFRSLKTEVLSIAKPALKELLKDNAHRKELSDHTVISEKMTGGEALALRVHQFETDTATKKKTKKYWREIVGLLKKTWPEFTTLEMRRVSVEDCQKWAGDAVGQMAASR